MLLRHEQSNQHAAVQYIIDSVVTGLARNSTDVHAQRAGLLQRWFYEQGEERQQLARRLVARKQLSFVGGGWSQNDEACPHYVTMIDQMTLGHKFLKQEFGYTPRVGWQIDPFGHSATHAALSAMQGFDAQYFARIDYQDRQKRRTEQSMEFLWRPSASLGSAADLFSGAFVAGTYCNPGELKFSDVQHDQGDLKYGAARIVDDPALEGNNVKQMVDTFVAVAQQYANWTRGNEVMFLLGCDYEWEHAEEWFSNIDKLIRHVNDDGRVQAFYSDPVRYTDAKHAEQGEQGGSGSGRCRRAAAECAGLSLWIPI